MEKNALLVHFYEVSISWKFDKTSWTFHEYAMLYVFLFVYSLTFYLYYKSNISTMISLHVNYFAPLESLSLRCIEAMRFKYMRFVHKVLEFPLNQICTRKYILQEMMLEPYVWL